jgi:hypothetical protein
MGEVQVNNISIMMKLFLDYIQNKVFNIYILVIQLVRLFLHR